MNAPQTAVVTVVLVCVLALLLILHPRPARADAPVEILPPHTGEGAAHLGWIPVQRAAPGETLTLDLHRFVHAREGDRLEVSAPASGCTAEFNVTHFTLRVRLARDAMGLIELPLRLHLREAATSPREGVLVIAVTPGGGHLFGYHAPTGKVERVTIAGGFNSWNKDANPMEKTGRRTFELYLPMPPGEQEYKFIVDGQWIADPAGTTAPNGNSILRIADVPRSEAPRVFLESDEGGILVFRVAGGEPAVNRACVTLQRPDGSSARLPGEIDGERVRVDTEGLPDGSWVRVIASGAGGTPGNEARGQVRPGPAFNWRDGVMYYAFTDRFVNGNPANDRPVVNPELLPQANYHGGDFEGIRARIEDGYFKKLGVNVVWISPLNRNPDGAWREYLEPHRLYSGYHGYWPVSHTEVEPRFGGEPALRGMIAAARANGVKIMADLVLKHVHVEHPLWKEKPEWFGSLTLPDGTKNLRQWDAHQFTTWFEEWLPGLDFAKEEPVRFLLDNARDFAERFQLDGYRLDAVKHIPPAFWWKFRAALRDQAAARGVPELYCVGETFMDRRGIMSFVGPNMLDGQFDFPLYDVLIEVFAKHAAGFEALEAALAASEAAYGKETLMSPLLGNHDKSRFMAFAEGDVPDPDIPDEEELGWQKPPRVNNPASYDRLKLAFSFILSLDGVPMIYYGDEVGLTGAGDPDNRRMMPLEAVLTPDQKAVRAHVAAVAAIRHAHPAMRYGSRRVLEARGPGYAFVRRHLGDAVLVAWNRSDEPRTFTLDAGPEMPDGSAVDALGGGRVQILNGKVVFTLQPMTSAFFTPEK